MSEANNDNPHVCDLNCAACPRRMCAGAAALARENRDDATAGLANAAEAPHALERIGRRCAQALEACEDAGGEPRRYDNGNPQNR